MCGCASNSTSGSGSGNAQRVVAPQPEDCDMTMEILLNYKSILTCIKAGGKQEKAGLTQFDVNQNLGIIQSGLNYPDNYCYYMPQLDNFVNNLLPRIIENVPECIQQ